MKQYAPSISSKLGGIKGGKPWVDIDKHTISLFFNMYVDCLKNMFSRLFDFLLYKINNLYGLIIFICNYEKKRGWATSSLNKLGGIKGGKPWVDIDKHTISLFFNMYVDCLKNMFSRLFDFLLYKMNNLYGLIIFICNYEKKRGWATSSLNISYGPPPTI